MAHNDIDYRQIRRRAEERLQRDKLLMRRIFFVVYLFMFILFMIISWGMYLSAGGALPQANIPGVANTNDPIAGAMVMLSMLGFMGVLFQFISLIVDTKAGERQMRERAYGRALGEEMMRLGEDEDSLEEKPKHMTRLTDDGELEEIVDDAAYDEVERKTLRK